MTKDLKKLNKMLKLCKNTEFYKVQVAIMQEINKQLGVYDV